MAANNYALKYGGHKYKGQRLTIFADKSIYTPRHLWHELNWVYHDFKEQEILLLQNSSHFMHIKNPNEIRELFNKFLL